MNRFNEHIHLWLSRIHFFLFFDHSHTCWQTRLKVGQTFRDLNMLNSFFSTFFSTNSNFVFSLKFYFCRFLIYEHEHTPRFANTFNECDFIRLKFFKFFFLIHLMLISVIIQSHKFSIYTKAGIFSTVFSFVFVILTICYCVCQAKTHSQRKITQSINWLRTWSTQFFVPHLLNRCCNVN